MFVTTFEVVLGILKVNEKLPEFIVYDRFLGLAWLTHIFIILTIVKAAYIVMTFMHLGDERKNLIAAIHAGWKGAYKDIISKVINFMIK